MIAIRSGWRVTVRHGRLGVGILLVAGCVQPSMYRADDVAWSLYGPDLFNGADIASPAARQHVAPIYPAHFTGCKPDDTGGALCVWDAVTWSGDPNQSMSLIMVLDRRPSGKYFVRDASVSPPGPSYDQLLAAENMPVAADSALVRFLLYVNEGSTDSALTTLRAAVALGAAHVAVAREAIDQATKWLGDGLVGEPYVLKSGRIETYGQPRGGWPESGWFTTDADSARVAQRYLAIAKAALDSDHVASFERTLNSLAAASWFVLAHANANAPATASSCEQLTRAGTEFDNAATGFRIVPATRDTEAMHAMRVALPSESARTAAMAAEACRQV
jgi:hypothetical protein